MKEPFKKILLSGVAIFVASIQLSATSNQYYLSTEFRIPFRSSEVFAELGRSAKDMVVIEDMLYVAGWDSFFQFDVSDPKHPQLVSKMMLNVEKLVPHASYLYGVGQTKLDVFRVHSKSPFEHISSLSFADKVIGYVKDEHLGYVALASHPDNSSADQIKVYDLTLPESPEMLITWDNVPRLEENNWCVDEGFLFVHYGLDLEVYEMYVMDPPQKVARISSGNRPGISMLMKEGDTLYVFGWVVQIIDVSDPYHPILETEITVPRNKQADFGSLPMDMDRMADFLVLSGEMHYDGSGFGLSRSGYVALVDLKHPEEAEVVLERNIFSIANQSVDEKLWALNPHFGVTIFDIEPASFTLETTTLTQPFVEVLDSNVDLSLSMTLEEGRLASDLVESLHTHWNGRTQFDFTKLWRLGNEVVVDQGIAYTIGSVGLRIFDVHDPQDPIKLGQWDTFDPGKIEIQSPNLFLLDDTGLKVIDCTNPREPIHLASVPLTEHEYVTAFTVDEQFVYVGMERTVFFINTRQILNPIVEGQIQITSLIHDLEIYGHYLYLLTSNGIELIDVADPLHPSHRGGNSSFSFQDLDLIDGSILVTGFYGNEMIAAIGSNLDPRLLIGRPADSGVLPLLIRGFPEQIIHVEHSSDNQTWKPWRTVKMTGFVETVHDRTQVNGNLFYRIAGESNP
jgi:hypothetical protein